MVSSAVVLGQDASSVTASTFCNLGINTYVFAPTPAAFTYQVHYSGGSTFQTYCNFPTSLSALQTACDTQYAYPPSRLFCSCAIADCSGMSDSSRRLSIKEEGAEVPEISQQDIRNTRQEEEGVLSPPLPGEALLRDDDDKNIPAVNTIVLLETVRQIFRASITEVLLGDAAVNSDNHYYYTAITVLVVCSTCITLLLLYYYCFTLYLHRPANPTADTADTTSGDSSTVLHLSLIHI